MSTTITIGSEEHTLKPLTADQALRLLDIAAACADDLNAVMEQANTYRRRYAEENALTITPAAFDDPDTAARLIEAGYTIERVEQAGGEIRLPIEPAEAEWFAAVLPGAYRSLRGPILDACAICLAPADELMDAEDDGTLDEYLKGWTRMIRSEATPGQLAELLWEVFQHARDEVLGGAVGKLLGRVGLTSPASAPKKKSTPERPAKPRSSTRSRKPQAGADATSSS